MDRQTPPRPPAIIAEAGVKRAGIPAVDFLRRHKHWTAPPLLIVPFTVAAFALAAFRERTGTIVAAAVLAGCVWWFAPHKWTDKKGKPRMREVWYARVSAIGAGAWLSAASFTGVTWIMTAVLAGLLLAWGIPWFIHKRPRVSKAAKAIVAEWDTWWRHHSGQWGLHGSVVCDVASKGTMETLTVQLWKGQQSVRNVQDVTELIESALAGYVRPGMVRVDRYAKDASKALVRLKREDPLAEPSGWNPGMAIASITEPAPLGFTESGDTIQVRLDSSWFIIGKTRGGKSNELSVMLAAITGCPDARVWLIDMKGGRAARPWLPAVDWVATGRAEADLMMTVLKDEIKGRAMNGDDSTEQMHPTPEVPAIFLVIDETYEVTSVAAGSSKLASDLAVIASQGAGVVVITIVLTQYGALAESVQTEQTRSNLPNRMCFAVTDARHGQFALSDWASLDASKLREKGAFYMQLGPDSPSAPGRGYHMSHDLVRQVAARHGAMPRLPLVLYASQHQETYDQRWARLPQPFWRSAPQTASLSPSVIPPKETTMPDSYDATAHAMAARIDTEAAHLPDTEPARMPTNDEFGAVMAANKAAFARALQSAPAEGISPKQLQDASGMGRSWVMAQLKALCEHGHAMRVSTGMYRAAEGADIAAALDEIRRSQDALLSV